MSMRSIEDWRKEKGYSLKEAAIKLDCSVHSLKKYEEDPGKTPLHICVLIKHYL